MVLVVLYRAALRRAVRMSGGTRTGRGLDPVGTSIAMQEKLMQQADIRTTMNNYGHVVTDELVEACSEVAGMAFKGYKGVRRTLITRMALLSCAFYFGFALALELALCPFFGKDNAGL